MELPLIYSVFGSVMMLAVFFAANFYFRLEDTRKKAAQLEIEKHNFETISKKANDIILTIDIATGKIYNANNQASKVLGYPHAKLIKKTIHDLHPRELWKLSAETIAEVWEKKGLVYQNLPFLTAQAELIDVECSAKVLIYDDKPVIIIYARDIRERLRLERSIRKQNELITEKNKNITDSITYASRIQEAVLGKPDYLKKLFDEAFTFFKPHSMVSGDFYWFHRIGHYKIAIAADCTGHGVPGAFMTLLGYNYLSEIIENKKIIMPDEILNELNKKITASLNKESAEKRVNDGMDIAVLTFDTEQNKLYYSGAKNPLCIVKDGEMEVIKASRSAIGGLGTEKQYDLHNFNLEKGSTVYIYSDGFQDQFGGNKNRKFLSKKFRNLLLEISPYEPEMQKSILEKIFTRWKGDNEQTDDVVIVGIKV